MLSVCYESGTYADYASLRYFHYRPDKPATLAGVLRAMATDRRGRAELAGVAVLSFPAAMCAERHRTFGLRGLRLGDRLRWTNKNLRTVSRLIVHPTYRGLGIGSGLVRRAIEQAPTPYLEALSHLGRAMPVFERAGMTLVEGAPSRPAYYWAATGRPHSGQGSQQCAATSGVARRP